MRTSKAHFAIAGFLITLGTCISSYAEECSVDAEKNGPLVAEVEKILAKNKIDLKARGVIRAICTKNSKSSTFLNAKAIMAKITRSSGGISDKDTRTFHEAVAKVAKGMRASQSHKKIQSKTDAAMNEAKALIQDAEELFGSIQSSASTDDPCPNTGGTLSHSSSSSRRSLRSSTTTASDPSPNMGEAAVATDESKPSREEVEGLKTLQKSLLTYSKDANKLSEEIKTKKEGLDQKAVKTVEDAITTYEKLLSGLDNHPQIKQMLALIEQMKPHAASRPEVKEQMERQQKHLDDFRKNLAKNYPDRLAKLKQLKDNISRKKADPSSGLYKLYKEFNEGGFQSTSDGASEKQVHEKLSTWADQLDQTRKDVDRDYQTLKRRRDANIKGLENPRYKTNKTLQDLGATLSIDLAIEKQNKANQSLAKMVANLPGNYLQKQK